MGAGKTVVGQALAKDLKMNLLDTDELIEQTAGRKIVDIFKTEGEDYFRDLETEVLKTLEDYDNFVLSTGGGMVLRAENIILLKKIGTVVLLWAEPDIIYERIKSAVHRPLLKVADPKAEIVRVLGIRRPLYEKAADLSVDTTRLNVDEVADAILKNLKARENNAKN